jgi:hypothetical protein
MTRRGSLSRQKKQELTWFVARAALHDISTKSISRHSAVL